MEPVDQTQEDLERDKWIAKNVMGWEFKQPRHGWCCMCQRCGRDYEECDSVDSCDFSTSNEAVWNVVAKMREKGFCLELRDIGNHYVARFYRSIEEAGDYDMDLLPSRVICKAAMFILERG